MSELAARSGASQPPLAVDCSPADESAFIALLLDSEPQHQPQPEYLRLCRNNAVRRASRQDSISSILKVRAHFRFKPVTAFLSINYLDRFLSSHAFPETGWQFQLLSMACLSIAAKMEEVSVPLLLALQILEPTYVFEPKTIQRMELAVMATLEWRLLCVTPFDYLHFFISKLPSASKPDSVSTVHSLASDIILNTARVIDFLGFPPSVIAAAAVVSVAREELNLPENFDDRVDKEMVRSCHQLIDEYLLDTCPSGCHKLVSLEPHAPPQSPVAVLDAADCASCETHSENPDSGSAAAAAVAEPDNKRQRSATRDVQEP